MALNHYLIMTREARNDYQGTTRTVDGIVYSPNKYRETEGIKDRYRYRGWSKSSSSSSPTRFLWRR